MCRSYGDQFELLVKDKNDISSYLKKEIDLRNQQLFDLNDRLSGLQQIKNNDKNSYEKNFKDLNEKFQSDIQILQEENLALKTRLMGLEEFKNQRQTLEKTIGDLKNLLVIKEDAYQKALEQMEIALIHFKQRLKKEAIEYLNDLAIEFHSNTKSQLSNTIKRTIKENFHLNNQIDYLTNQLEKTIQVNQISNQKNQHLIQTVNILEDIQSQSAKKYFTTENIVRTLCNKLKECQQQKTDSIQQLIIPEQTNQKESMKIDSNEESNVEQKQESHQIQNLKNENNLLRDIIDQAARAIADVIQSQNNEDEKLKIEKRNDMLEQFLSILLTSHRLGRTGLALQKNSHFYKGIFPGTRLGLHQIHPDSSTKINTHYSLGDLGIIPSNKTV